MEEEYKVENPPIFINLTTKFGGHKLIKELYSIERENGKIFVVGMPVVKIKEPTFWEKFKGRYKLSEANKVYEELLEADGRIAFYGTGKYERDSGFYVSQNPKEWPTGILQWHGGRMMQLIQELKNSEMTLQHLVRVKEMTRQQQLEFLSSDETSEYIEKRVLDKLKRVVQLKNEEAVRDAKKPSE